MSKHGGCNIFWKDVYTIMKKSTKFIKTFFVVLLAVVMVAGIATTNIYAAEASQLYRQIAPFDYNAPAERPPK